MTTATKYPQVYLVYRIVNIQKLDNKGSLSLDNASTHFLMIIMTNL